MSFSTLHFENKGRQGPTNPGTAVLRVQAWVRGWERRLTVTIGVVFASFTSAGWTICHLTAGLETHTGCLRKYCIWEIPAYGRKVQTPEGVYLRQRSPHSLRGSGCRLQSHSTACHLWDLKSLYLSEPQVP